MSGMCFIVAFDFERSRVLLQRRGDFYSLPFAARRDLGSGYVFMQSISSQDGIAYKDKVSEDYALDVCAITKLTSNLYEWFHICDVCLMGILNREDVRLLNGCLLATTSCTAIQYVLADDAIASKIVLRVVQKNDKVVAMLAIQNGKWTFPCVNVREAYAYATNMKTLILKHEDGVTTLVGNLKAGKAAPKNMCWHDLSVVPDFCDEESKAICYSLSGKVPKKGGLYCDRLPPDSGAAKRTKVGYGTVLARLLVNSLDFKHAIPTEANTIKNYGGDKEHLAMLATKAHPAVHEKTWSFLSEFIAHQRQRGSPAMKLVYARMTPAALVVRCLTKRPIVFFSEADDVMLRNGESGYFEQLEACQDPAEYITYDEMPVSALISMHTQTPFINSGSRYNRGEPGSPGTFVAEGVYSGLVGARFEKDGVMEFAHMVITEEQNTAVNGYGPGKGDPLLKLWALQLYGYGSFPTYAEALRDPAKYPMIDTGRLFNTDVYKKRMELVFAPFFVEANEYASEQLLPGHVRLNGIGLGVWRLDGDVQLRAYAQAVQETIAKLSLPNVGVIDVSAWDQLGITATKWTDRDGHAIDIMITREDPAAPIRAGHCLIASYAWDGAAYPGNEYWVNMLTASGDPAAACCSFIPELQNPEINTGMLRACAVCGEGRTVVEL